MRICDCNLTGGCFKCNTIKYYININQRTVKVKIETKQLEALNFIWADCDLPPQTIIVVGDLIEEIIN